MRLVIYSGQKAVTVEDRPVVVMGGGGASTISAAPGNTLTRKTDGLYAPGPELSTDHW